MSYVLGIPVLSPAGDVLIPVVQSFVQNFGIVKAVPIILQAAECGADAVLVMTPAYVKPSQKGMVKFFEIVADQGALPVVLYNV